MKYFNVNSINRAIKNVRELESREHVTGTVGTEVTRNYFEVGRFTITPEQTQKGGRRPDLAVQKYIEENDSLVPHAFVEFKALLNSNFNDIVDQLGDTVCLSLDDFGFSNGNYSVFMIALKGTKIAFYTYHNFGGLLYEYGVGNYEGFIPLTEKLQESSFHSYYKNVLKLDGLSQLLYDNYSKGLSDFNIVTDWNTLKQLGVESTNRISHPHIWDLANPAHKEHIHNMFNYANQMNANKLFRGN